MGPKNDAEAPEKSQAARHANDPEVGISTRQPACTAFWQRPAGPSTGPSSRSEPVFFILSLACDKSTVMEKMVPWQWNAHRRPTICGSNRGQKCFRRSSTYWRIWPKSTTASNRRRCDEFWPSSIGRHWVLYREYGQNFAMRSYKSLARAVRGLTRWPTPQIAWIRQTGQHPAKVDVRSAVSHWSRFHRFGEHDSGALAFPAQ